MLTRLQPCARQMLHELVLMPAAFAIIAACPMRGFARRVAKGHGHPALVHAC